MNSSDQANIRIATQGKTAIVSFTGPCVSDTEKLARASAQLKQYIAENSPLKLVFDFAEVKFFSSQVLGLILEARAQLQPRKGRVIIRSIHPQHHRVFRITNLDRILEFSPDPHHNTPGNTIQ